MPRPGLVVRPTSRASARAALGRARAACDALAPGTRTLEVTARRFAAAAIVLPALGLLASACSPAPQPPPTAPPPSTPTLAIPPPATATPSAPTLTPLPSPTPAPTLTPVPPTATPVPALPLHVSALLDPPTPHAGEDFTLALSVGNDGDRQAQGVYIATTGPWDEWQLLGIEPPGTFNRDAAGWALISNVEIPPGETRTIQMHLRADEPAQEQLTFAVREATSRELAP